MELKEIIEDVKNNLTVLKNDEIIELLYDSIGLLNKEMAIVVIPTTLSSSVINSIDRIEQDFLNETPNKNIKKEKTLIKTKVIRTSIDSLEEGTIIYIPENNYRVIAIKDELTFVLIHKDNILFIEKYR